MRLGSSRRNMSGAQPAPRIRTGLPLMTNWPIALLGEVGADAAYAERRAGPIRGRSIDGSGHLQTVERMRTHADRPPDLRMVRSRPGSVSGENDTVCVSPGSEVDRAPQRNAGHDARDRGVVRRRIEVPRLHFHGQRGAREIGQR